MSNTTELPQTKVERHYVEQGYSLPAGITWAMVSAARSHISPVRDIDVPVATASGCTAWGVPIIDGKHLDWRSILSPDEIARLSEEILKPPRGTR
jgi:hypothetical protein